MFDFLFGLLVGTVFGFLYMAITAAEKVKKLQVYYSHRLFKLAHELDVMADELKQLENKKADMKKSEKAPSA